MTPGPTPRELALALPCIALGAYALAYHLRDALRLVLGVADAIRVAAL